MLPQGHSAHWRYHAPQVVELGIGSGALAERCLRAFRVAHLIGLDADPAMLDQAAHRLAPYASRVTLTAGDFSLGVLPAGDAFVASLALHHLHTPVDKQRVYRRIARSLRPGGLLVSADAALPDDPAVAALAQDAWRAHLRQFYTAAETRSYFRAWSKEDTYFTLGQELTMVRRAGLLPEIVWRTGAFAVVAARKPDSGPTEPRAERRTAPSGRSL